MKGRLWCAGMKVVDVPHGNDPKPVTFVYPYFDNPDFLRRQIAWWGTYPQWLRDHLTAIVVDDGSPTSPAAEQLAGLALPFQIRLFRIEIDIRWNWLAARNIGMHYAAPGWCLVTDIDHVVPESTATSVVFGQHDPSVIYAFSRIEHTGDKVSPHSASFLMTREMFWRVGGYDERMSGFYGTDGHFRRRLAAAAPIQILCDRLIRHEYVGDSSTTKYLRKQPEDGKLKALMRTWHDATPKTLSFPYHEVAL